MLYTVIYKVGRKKRKIWLDAKDRDAAAEKAEHYFRDKKLHPDSIEYKWRKRNGQSK